MSSLFSFLSRESELDEPAAAEPEITPAAAVISAAPEVAMAVFSGEPGLELVLSQMLDQLRPFLPGFQAGLPQHNVSVASVTQRPLSIGNYRGLERRGSFDVATLKGGRLEAVVTFQLWANNPGEADSAIDELHGRLLAGRDGLRIEGFLRFEAEGQSLAEPIPSLNAWRKTADYRVLYEYHFIDDDGAHSLIARIPITVDSDTSTEFTLVTDEMVRWDDETAPTLLARGQLTVRRLTALSFVPGAVPGGTISLRRTSERASGTPTSFASLEEFLAAVSDETAPNRHAEITFASLDQFLALFEPTGGPITLGDWDEDGLADSYQPFLLQFATAIPLPGVSDRLELAYQDNEFDQTAIVYLQLA